MYGSNASKHRQQPPTQAETAESTPGHFPKYQSIRCKASYPTVAALASEFSCSFFISPKTTLRSGCQAIKARVSASMAQPYNWYTSPRRLSTSRACQMPSLARCRPMAPSPGTCPECDLPSHGPVPAWACRRLRLRIVVVLVDPACQGPPVW